MAILYSESEIQKALNAVAPDIVGVLGKNFTLVPILTGGFLLAADLCRALYRAGADPEIDFLQLASYGDKRESSGNVRIVKDLNASVEGRSILIVDDVLDSGRSLLFAKRLMQDRRAGKIATCVAVDKKKERPDPVEADFSLFTTGGDAFLVGYGMDDAGARRAMPDIGVVD